MLNSCWRTKASQTTTLRRSAFWLPLAMVTLVLLLLVAKGANSQTNLATISGTISDANGAVISNSTVTVINKSTTAKRVTTVNATGFYSFPSLPLGTYAITATAPGFQASTTTVDLTLSGVTANLSLAVGGASETVTVSEASGTVALQTESVEVSQSFGTTQLQKLPNSAGLSVLSVAVTGPASQAGTDEPEVGDEGFYGQTGNTVNIAGLGIAHTQFLQDGVENVNLLTQSANVVSNVEASEGVSTTVNGSPARFGQPAVVNVITKGGTNSFHGSAYEYLQNDDLNATNYFATSKAPLRYNQFGTSLGGPIVRNRLFAYFNYTGLRSHQQNVTRARVPTTAELGGDFSSNNLSTVIYDPATYDPTTGTSQPFQNNQIPTSRFDNFAKLWLENYPAANHTLGSDNINYVANLPSSDNGDSYIVRGDWNISASDQLTGIWMKSTVNSGSNTITPGLFGIYDNTLGTNASFQETHIFNQHLVNIVKIGYDRGDVERTQQGTSAKDYATYYGLKNLGALPDQWTPPQVSITNYTGLGDPYSPQGGLQNRYQYADELDWNLGKHSFAFGGQFVRTLFKGNWVVANNGMYTFDGSATSQYVNGQRSSTSTGNGFADLLLGYPETGTAAIGTSLGYYKESQVDGYVQDDWKIFQKLTFNLGLRYDFDNPPYDTKGKSALYVLTLNEPVPNTWDTNYNDWSPRFGFSWNVLKDTVLRGGYGVYYSPILYNNLQFSLLYAPNFVQQTHTINMSSPVTIENLMQPSSSGTTAYTLQKKLKDQSAQEWNLNIERSLNANTLLTVAYIGDVQRHASGRADSNQPYGLSAGNTTGILDLRPQPAIGPLTTQINVLTANYNALAATLSRRYANGLQYLISYTWSKAMDIIDGDNSDVEDYWDLKKAYSPASFDRTHNLLVSGVYDLPFGTGRRFLNTSSWINREALGGWQLSFLQQIASGQPTTINALNEADTSYVHPMYALQTCNPKQGFTKSRFVLFNASCFAQPAVGEFGKTRNVSAIREPGLYPTNLSLFKSFPVVGEHEILFRADAFSVFNHPEFGGAGGTVGSSALGVLSSQASGLRTMQVSLKYQF